jgi:hypothetical protein
MDGGGEKATNIGFKLISLYTVYSELRYLVQVAFMMLFRKTCNCHPNATILCVLRIQFTICSIDLFIALCLHFDIRMYLVQVVVAAVVVAGK